MNGYKNFLTSCIFYMFFTLTSVSITFAAGPSIHPVGTLRYDPSKTWNSYVILASDNTAKLVDRNGNLVHEWDLRGGAAYPAKVYPGGYFLGTIYPVLLHANSSGQDWNTLALLDFDGNIVRKFSKHQRLEKGEGEQPIESDGSFWASRLHHDFQLEGSSTGYYAPNAEPCLDGKILILAHENIINQAINPNRLIDDVLLLVDKNENILWKWRASDHFEEFGFSEEARAQTRAIPEAGALPFDGVDWFHINCASWLGPNKWYDAGDKRFHPDNIIADSRNTSHLFIIDHESGNIVWQVSPPFVGTDAQLRPLAGVHHTHMIPRGLPGAGNILVFDNGGTFPTYPSQNHAWSRVVEFNPITKEKIWEFSSAVKGLSPDIFGANFFFSTFVSSSQRLPNGNTLICEGSTCRILEVTVEGDIVWEYISPYNLIPGNSYPGQLYRAYAVPYEWVPQLPHPVEKAVLPPDMLRLVIPDVEGQLPQYRPVLDKNPRLNFGVPVPVGEKH